MVLSPHLICNIFPNYCQSYSIDELATKSGISEDTPRHELWKASHLAKDGGFFDDASKEADDKMAWLSFLLNFSHFINNLSM